MGLLEGSNKEGSSFEKETIHETWTDVGGQRIRAPMAHPWCRTKFREDGGMRRPQR